jgi:ATP-dependent Clp protease ATP-binding subunit ClpA
MWQRFTERARRVVFFAQEEAGRLGSNIVDTEHLLLGLVRENDSVAARILDRLGVSIKTIRQEVESQVERGDGRLGQDMQLAPRAKRVIDLAYDEARQLNNEYIGTEHLLLGLIREEDGLGALSLSKLGIGLDRARVEVLAMQDIDSGAGGDRVGEQRASWLQRVLGSLGLGRGMWLSFRADARRAVFLAQEEAAKLDRSFVDTEHLLLGLISEKDTVAAGVLSQLGIGLDAIRGEIEPYIERGEGRCDTDMQLAPRAKRVIDLTFEEARRLRHNSIGTEHLLLGLTGECEGVAGRVLAKLGVDLKAARNVVETIHEAETTESPPPGQAGETPAGDEAEQPPTAHRSGTWSRFTEHARRVVFFAQEEAGRLGENYVSTEHLLLGIAREDDSVAARILDRLGVSLRRIRSEIERQVTRGDGRLGQDMQLTPRAKRVIDLAFDESRQLGSDHIGSEHLLLGLVREADGLAGRVLAKLGVEFDRARREAQALSGCDASLAATPPLVARQQSADMLGWDVFTDAARRAVFAGLEEAARLGEHIAATEHLLLGLIRDESGFAARILLHLGVDLTVLRDELGRLAAHGDSVLGMGLRLAPESKVVIDLAYDEVRELDGEHVGTEHLLLGLVRQADGIAGQVLARLGVDPDRARCAVTELTQPGDDPGAQEGR